MGKSLNHGKIIQVVSLSVLIIGLVMGIFASQQKQNPDTHAAEDSKRCSFRGKIWVSTDGTNFTNISGKDGEKHDDKRNPLFAVPAGTTKIWIKGSKHSNGNPEPNVTARMIFGKYLRKKGAVCVNQTCQIDLSADGFPYFFEAFENEVLTNPDAPISQTQQLYWNAEKCRTVGGITNASSNQ